MRMARGRRLGQEVLDVTAGQRARFHFRDGTGDSDGVCAECRCLKRLTGQGSGVAFRVSCSQRPNDAPRVHFRLSNALSACVPASSVFTVFPE